MVAQLREKQSLGVRCQAFFAFVVVVRYSRRKGEKKCGGKKSETQVRISSAELARMATCPKMVVKHVRQPIRPDD